MAKTRQLIRSAFLALSVVILGLFGLAGWAIAPFPAEFPVSARTAGWIAKAPFAGKIVIGDSRIEYAEATDEAMFVGYSGATIRELERMSRVLCAVSDAPVVMALGVNDTRPGYIDPAASIASLSRIVDSCGPERVHLAGIWPAEPEIEPLGPYYDMQEVERISTAMEELAAQSGAAFTPAPQLDGHTFDGVHFTADVSARYLSFLAGLATSNTRGSGM